MSETDPRDVAAGSDTTSKPRSEPRSMGEAGGPKNQLKDLDVKTPKDKEVAEQAIKGQLIVTLVAMGLGVLVILAGASLAILGVTGSVSWTATFLGAKSQLADAAPGTVLAIVGLFIVLSNPYNIR